MLCRLWQLSVVALSNKGWVIASAAIEVDEAARLVPKVTAKHEFGLVLYGVGHDSYSCERKDRRRRCEDQQGSVSRQLLCHFHHPAHFGGVVFTRNCAIT